LPLIVERPSLPRFFYDWVDRRSCRATLFDEDEEAEAADAKAEDALSARAARSEKRAS
jgi:hypothetical protein